MLIILLSVYIFERKGNAAVDAGMLWLLLVFKSISMLSAVNTGFDI
ncbi:hypothetical protein IDJ75_03600 [Mucilaginibacter rigui]|uniref:Uncharacterized protein n=1 Tax=Mucilaginibacter rigui TaxID=534635 RepID=A0ABR7X2W9_9SPHI|nr:hypothetical protein [Mucilaginibacter rigui]MBD1384350.1 hypothetical protein [Mucilaginibacter rigui]